MKTFVFLCPLALLYTVSNALPLNKNDKFCRYLLDHWVPTVESAIVDQLSHSLSHSRLLDESAINAFVISVRKGLLTPIVKDFRDRIHFVDSKSKSFLSTLLLSWKESTEKFLWTWMNRNMKSLVPKPDGSQQHQQHQL